MTTADLPLPVGTKIKTRDPDKYGDAEVLSLDWSTGALYYTLKIDPGYTVIRKHTDLRKDFKRK